MKRPNREEILGYLIGALEPEERRCIERSLQSDPELNDELNEISRQLFEMDELPEATSPPAGLARRTCEAIAALDPTPAPTRKPTPSDRLQPNTT